MNLQWILGYINLKTVLTAVASAFVIGVFTAGVRMVQSGRGEVVRLRRLNLEASKLRDNDPVDEVLSAAIRRQVATRLVSLWTLDAAAILCCCYWVILIMGAFLACAMWVFILLASVFGVKMDLLSIAYFYALIAIGLFLSWIGWVNWQTWRTWRAWRQTLKALLKLPIKRKTKSVEECEQYRPGPLVPACMRPKPTDPAIEAMKILAGRRL